MTRSRMAGRRRWRGLGGGERGGYGRDLGEIDERDERKAGEKGGGSHRVKRLCVVVAGEKSWRLAGPEERYSKFV